MLDSRYTPIMVTSRTRHAVAGLDGPLAVLDLDAADRNAESLIRRAGGVPIRLASKSIRVPELLKRVLALDGYAGILAFSLPEALELHNDGFTDIVVAYPTVNKRALASLAGSADALATITLMIDSVEHIEFLEHAVGDVPLRLCIDVDGSLRIGSIHIGTRRSPIRIPEQALDLLGRIESSPFTTVGLMCYEGQIAGVGNAGKGAKARAVRGMQGRSAIDLTERRTAIVRAVRDRVDLEFVNGGGTGSLESSAGEGSLTEVAAGSGIYSPGLFDGYEHFRHEPSLFAAVPVVRRPAPGWVTVFEGGWIASGPAGADRLPHIDWPRGLAYSPTEGPGEVQTPLKGKAADTLNLGDHAFLRHAKAGELLEHFPSVTAVSGGSIVDTWKTYRGRGWRF